MSTDQWADEQRVTFADIAREAGVSVPTVSKVLNGKPGVSPSTRRRVSNLLQEHDYAPRRSNPRGMVELVLGELRSPWSAALVSAMELAASEDGSGLCISRAGGSAGWLDSVLERRSDGVVFAVVAVTAEQRQRLRDSRRPFVLIDPGTTPIAGVPTIGVTNWQGAFVATEHLVSLGHRRLAMIAGPTDMLFSVARADGFRAAAAAADLPAPEVVHTEFGYEAGRDAAVRLLAGAERPSAIFTASDEQAMGVYEAARRAKLRIPEDLSVVGFNDVDFARWAAPPLTTVREPIHDIARQAISALRALASDDRVPAVELMTQLVVRESTAAFK